MTTDSRADKQWFGQPAGLSTLFFTEMWERFSFYGMRAILLLFMTTAADLGGMGWDTAKAGPIYGLYTAMVYLTALPGGWVADRIFGQRKAVFVGGVIITLGHIALALHGLAFFYLGLFLIVIGTGLLKPNISTIVGQLYEDGDARRDSGFSIFYMGINLGAFLAPLVCGYLAQSDHFKGVLTSMNMDPINSWHWGFGAAAVGMTLGLIQYVLGAKNLGDAGLHPAVPDNPQEHAKQVKTFYMGTVAVVAVIGIALAINYSGMYAISTGLVVKVMGVVLLIIPVAYFSFLFSRPEWNPEERKRLYAIPVFFLAAALFWSAFEQAGSTLTLFADRNTETSFLGIEFPSSWFQSVNSVFILMLAPFFAWLWISLKSKEPSSPAKFSYGLFFLGMGFLVLAFGAMVSGEENVRISPLWLMAVYFLHTIGELCLSPVGLSTMTKLAPAKVGGQMMGIWFLASSLGNYIGGIVAGFFESFPLPVLFGAIFGTTMIATLLMVAVIKPVRELMSGVH